MNALTSAFRFHTALERGLDTLRPWLLLAFRLWVSWQFWKSGWIKISNWDVTLELFRSEYQVPLAILSLQQGLGRLIRHRSDRGVLAILDPRLATASYGRRFLASLPPAPVTRDLVAVDRFFK